MNTVQRQCRSAEGLDRNTAERLFVGLAADDAPPDFASVAAVLVAAAAAIDRSSTAPGEFSALRAYRDAVSAGAPGRTEYRLQPWRTAAGRIAVFTAAGALAIGGGVAAAATGSLPVPAQRVVHQILGGFGVPADVTPGVDPADLIRIIGEASASTSPDATVLQRARTAAPATTQADPRAPFGAVPATSPAAGPSDETGRDDHGEAVSLLARPVDSGSSHGAAECIVASGGACITDDETRAHTAADRRSETGVENSAKKGRGQTRSDHSAKARQDAHAVADSVKDRAHPAKDRAHPAQDRADSVKDRRKGAGAADPAQSHRSTTGAEHSAKEHRRSTGAVNSAQDRRSSGGVTGGSATGD